MLVRLKYIGKTKNFVKDKTYYMRLNQKDDLQIVIKSAAPKEIWPMSYEYRNLEVFLREWKILKIDKGVANARIHSK